MGETNPYGSPRARLAPLEIYDQPLGGPEFSGDREWQSPSPRGVALRRQCGTCAGPGGRAVCAGRAVIVLAEGAPVGAVLVLDARALGLTRVLLVIFSRCTRLDFPGPWKSLNTWPTSLNLARLCVPS